MVLGLREEGRTRSNNTNAPNPEDHWTAYTNPSLDEEEEANKGKYSWGQKVKRAYANQVLTEEKLQIKPNAPTSSIGRLRPTNT